MKSVHCFVPLQLFAAITVSLGLVPPFAEAATAPVSLDVAVRNGLVEVDVRGRGSCSGDAVSVSVRRKAKQNVHVVVEPGTVLESTSGDVQRMACHQVKYERLGRKYKRVDVMVLNDEAEHTFLLEAYCLDQDKPTPTRESQFTIGSTDRIAARIIENGKKAGATIGAIQVAIWNRSDTTDFEGTSRSINASPTETEVARGILAASEAAEQGDAAEEEEAVQRVHVQVQNYLKKLIERRKELPYIRGDMVEITADEAPIHSLVRKIATAQRGDTFLVEAVGAKDVRVSVEVEGEEEPVRGWLSFDDIKLAEGAPRGKGRPVLRRLGELISETELEVITAAERGF